MGNNVKGPKLEDSIEEANKKCSTPFFYFKTGFKLRFRIITKMHEVVPNQFVKIGVERVAF